MYKLLTLLSFAALSSVATFGQDTVVRVYADQKNQVHVVHKTGRTTIVAEERGQVGVDSVQIAEDGQTAGWLALYEDPDGGSPIAGTLLLWRGGKVVRRVEADQTFWSWSFYAHAAQIAYHVGPMHGETTSHCELHETESGRLLASWDGDLDDTNRPPWTKALEH